MRKSDAALAGEALAALPLNARITDLERQLAEARGALDKVWAVERDMGASSLPAVQDFRDRLYAILGEKGA